MKLPYVIYKCAVSLDGCLGSGTNKRLILSNRQDWQEVDKQRALSDAILIGAGTIRADNPRLLVRSKTLRLARIKTGKTSNPIKITLTAHDDLDPNAKFFTLGESTKLVYTTKTNQKKLTKQLRGRAKIIAFGKDKISLKKLLGNLAEKKIKRILLEGGGELGKEFIKQNLVDELEVSVAPIVVNNNQAPRLTLPSVKQQSATNGLKYLGSRKIGKLVMFSWLKINKYLSLALRLAKRCPPSDTAFSVGAVIVNSSGEVIATGYSRETGKKLHAEEVAIKKALSKHKALNDCTLYSSLEPCGKRQSSKLSCADLIIKNKIPRVIFAVKEPTKFIKKPIGESKLRKAGVDVVYLRD